MICQARLFARVDAAPAACYRASVARRKGKAPKRLPSNAVYEAIQKAGGPTKAASLMGISAPTLQRWRKQGWIPDLRAALALAKASGLDVTRFAPPDE